MKTAKAGKLIRRRGWCVTLRPQVRAKAYSHLASLLLFQASRRSKARAARAAVSV
jgi:hypothetical protein